MKRLLKAFVKAMSPIFVLAFFCTVGYIIIFGLNKLAERYGINAAATIAVISALIIYISIMTRVYYTEDNE